MEYHKIKPIDVKESEKILKSNFSKDELIDLLVRISYYIDDMKYIVCKLNEYFDYDEDVTWVVIICCGHLARIHWYTNDLLIKRIIDIKSNTSNSKILSKIENMIDDIKTFTEN